MTLEDSPRHIDLKFLQFSTRQYLDSSKVINKSHQNKKKNQKEERKIDNNKVQY